MCKIHPLAVILPVTILFISREYFGMFGALY